MKTIAPTHEEIQDFSQKGENKLSGTEKGRISDDWKGPDRCASQEQDLSIKKGIGWCWSSSRISANFSRVFL